MTISNSQTQGERVSIRAWDRLPGSSSGVLLAEHFGRIQRRDSIAGIRRNPMKVFAATTDGEPILELHFLEQESGFIAQSGQMVAADAKA